MRKFGVNVAMRLLIAMFFLISSGDIYGSSVKVGQKFTYTDTGTGIIYEYACTDFQVAYDPSTVFYGYGKCSVVGLDDNYVSNSVVIPEKVTLRLLSYEITASNEEVYDDIELKVEGISTLSSSKVTSITIPGSFKELGMTINCENLSSLIINEGIESLCNFTLNSNKLETLTLPESVTKLYNFTLNCDKLEILKFPESITYYNNVDVTVGNLKELQFGTSGLADVTEFSHVKVSSENCSTLIIPDGIEWLAGNKYKEEYSWSTNSSGYGKVLKLDVPALVSVTIPKSMKGSYYDFGYNMGQAPTLGVLYAGYFSLYCPKLETVCFKDDVTTIPTIFGCCTSLKNIVFPQNVERIDEYAFLGCTGLETLKIPTSVKSIGTGAFIGCSGLKDVYVYWPMPVEDDYDENFMQGWYGIMTAFTCIPYLGEDITINGIKIPSDVPSDTYNNAVLHLDIDPNRPLWDTNGPSTYRYKRTSPWKYFRHIKHDGFVVWTFNITISASGNGKVVYDYWPIDEDGGMSTTVETCEVRNDTKAFLIKTDWVPMEDEFKIVLDDDASLESVVVDGKDVTSKVEIDPKTKTGLLVLNNISSATKIDVKFSESEQQNDGVTLTANSYSRVYGDPNPTFEYTETDGKITSGTPALSCEATETSPVGTYDIIIAKGTVSNSTINLVNGTLTITKAPLTISAGNYTKVEGEENPTFTPTFSGFKNNETNNVLTQQPTITTTATKDSPAGSYPITVSEAEAQNYEIFYQEGTLTVTPTESANAKAYAVLSSDGKTVTFYYDTQKDSRIGVVEINNAYLGVTQTTDTNEPVSLSPYGEATQAVFDASFADYRPTSTAYWFTRCYKLASISEMKNLNTSEVTDMQSMFNDCTGLTSLDVSGFNTSNVTFMNSMFYGCSSLTNLDVSGFNTSNVTDMNGIFRGCSSLTSLDVSGFNTSKVSDMGMMEMFRDCSSLTSLDLSSFNTEKITWFATMFMRCSSLITIYVSDKWTTEKAEGSANMFKDCTSLVGGKGTKYDANHIDVTYAHIDGGASNPGYLTYKNAPAADKIQFADGNVKVICVQYWDTDKDGELSKDEAAAVKSIGTVFKEKQIYLFDELQYFTGLTAIDNNAFQKCKLLSTIKLPKSVREIGENAFTDCRELQTLELPATVFEIGQSAFAGCDNLVVTVAAGNEVYEAEDMMLYKKDKYGTSREILVFCSPLMEGNPNISATVTELADNCFYSCRSIRYVEVPESVTKLGDGVFVKCESLEMVKLGKNVEIIGEGCFNATPKLRSITVNAQNPYYAFDGGVLIQRQGNVLVAYPNAKGVVYEVREGIKSIGKWAFYHTDIASVSLPQSLTSIEDYAFYDCKDLKKIICNAKTVPSVAIKSFGDITFQQAKLIVPNEMKSQYRETDIWKNFAIIITDEGDANADGKVDAADVTDIANHIIGKATSTGKFDEEAADMNGDKVINAADIVMLIDLLTEVQ